MQCSGREEQHRKNTDLRPRGLACTRSGGSLLSLQKGLGYGPINPCSCQDRFVHCQHLLTGS
ncbi:MAG: hypothetical protein ACKO6F_09745 [Cyanobium sp.]